MNMKLNVFAFCIVLVGCSSQQVVQNEFYAPKGSLRFTTLQFAQQEGIETILYHPSITPTLDFELQSNKTINISEGEQGIQTALLELYDGTTFLPIMDDKVLTIYPLTNNYAGSGSSKERFNMNVTHVDELKYLVGNEALIQDEPYKKSSENIKSAPPLIAKQPVNTASSNADELLWDDYVLTEGNRSPSNKAKDNLPNKKSVSLVEANIASDKVDMEVEPKVLKPYVIQKGKSLRSQLTIWLKDFDIDTVVYDVSPALDAELKVAQKNNVTFFASDEQQLVTALFSHLSEKDKSLAFKAKFISTLPKFKNTKKVIIHQYPFDDVSLYKIAQGSLKLNAYELASHYGYKVIENKESMDGYSSWNLSIDPVIASDSYIVINDDVKFGFLQLFKEQPVKALLLDSRKTIFFAPKNKYTTKYQ